MSKLSSKDVINRDKIKRSLQFKDILKPAKRVLSETLSLAECRRGLLLVFITFFPTVSIGVEHQRHDSRGFDVRGQLLGVRVRRVVAFELILEELQTHNFKQ